MSGTAIDIENVKLEYSPDNGTTYLPIANHIPNTGSYEWAVPHHLSSHCLVRISRGDETNDDNDKQPESNLLYEFKFRVDEVDEVDGREKRISIGNDFTILLGDVKNEAINNYIPSLIFFHESDGKEYILFDGTTVELSGYEDFLLSMHTLQITLDNTNEKITVLVKGKPVLENIPLSRRYRFSPAVSFVVGEGVEVSIDDFNVKINSAQDAAGNVWNTLLNEDFERFVDKEQLKDSGWSERGRSIKEKMAESSIYKDNVSIVQGYSNAGKSLKLQSDGEHEAVIVKPFQVPRSFPFDCRISASNKQVLLLHERSDQFHSFSISLPPVIMFIPIQKELLSE